MTAMNPEMMKMMAATSPKPKAPTKAELQYMERMRLLQQELNYRQKYFDDTDRPTTIIQGANG